MDGRPSIDKSSMCPPSTNVLPRPSGVGDRVFHSLRFLAFCTSALAALLAIWTILSSGYSLDQVERAKRVMFSSTVSCLIYTFSIGLLIIPKKIGRPRSVSSRVLLWFSLTAVPLLPLFPWDCIVILELICLLALRLRSSSSASRVLGKREEP